MQGFKRADFSLRKRKYPYSPAFFEISSLGAPFTLIRFGLNLLVVFAIAFIIEKLLSDQDKKAIYENADKL